MKVFDLEWLIEDVDIQKSSKTTNKCFIDLAVVASWLFHYVFITITVCTVVSQVVRFKHLKHSHLASTEYTTT